MVVVVFEDGFVAAGRVGGGIVRVVFRGAAGLDVWSVLSYSKESWSEVFVEHAMQRYAESCM